MRSRRRRGGASAVTCPPSRHCTSHPPIAPLPRRQSKLHILRFCALAQKLTHFAAFPLPAKPASLGFCGVPCLACSAAGGARRLLAHRRGTAIPGHFVSANRAASSSSKQAPYPSLLRFSTKAHSFRYFSSPRKTRFAGLLRGSLSCLLRRRRRKTLSPTTRRGRG
jgi:hypothetical protein